MEIITDWHVIWERDGQRVRVRRRDKWIEIESTTHGAGGSVLIPLAALPLLVDVSAEWRP